MLVLATQLAIEVAKVVLAVTPFVSDVITETRRGPARQEQLLAFFDEAQQEMTKDDTKARLREAVRAGEVKPLSTCHRCCVPPQPEPKRWK